MPSTSSSEGAPARFRTARGEVVVLGTVQGLVSEAARVREVVARMAPRALALGVAPEAAAQLLKYEPDPEVDHFEDLPDHDYVYSHKLAEYGDVALPPPDLLEAARMSAEVGISLYGVDLPEEAYEETFTREVSTLGFLRYGRIQRRLARKPPKAATAEEFSLKWDAAIRRVRGIARVEALREAHMAAQARALADKVGGVVVLVVDRPRADGIAAALRGG